MAQNPERRDSFQPYSTLALAYAERIFTEGQRGNKRIATLLGNPYQFPSSEQRKTEIKDTTQRVDKILHNPQNNLVNRAIVRESMYRNATDAGLNNFNSMPNSDRSRHELEVRSMSEELVDTLGSESIEKSPRRILNILSGAQQIAEAKGIKAETVLEDDTLYDELIRHIFTPNDFAETAIVAAKTLTGDLLFGIIIKQTIPALRTVFGFPTDSSEGDASIEGVLRADENMKSETDARAYLLRKASYTVAVENIQRFWGEQGLEGLSEETRHILGLERGSE